MSHQHWAFQLGEPAPSTVRNRLLTKAKGRRCTWRVDGISDAQFTINGYDPEVKLVESLATDLYVTWNKQKLFRGRIGTEYDEHTGRNYHTTFSAMDYRGFLRWALIDEDGASFTNVSQATIPMTLIDMYQARPGGNLGIVSGVGGASAILRTVNFKPGRDLLDIITSLGRLDGGFEWTINPDMELDRWYPYRGSEVGTVIDFSAHVTEFRRTSDPNAFGSAVLALGSNQTRPVALDGITGTARGRWEVAEAFSDIDNQAALEAKARWLRRQVSTVRPDITATLKQGFWRGPNHFWIGDVVRCVLKKGRLDTNDLFRVAEFNLSIDENSRETIKVGLTPANTVYRYGSARYGQAAYV